MEGYSLNQWLLFFFIYCFVGWIWESCYVSVKSKKWINRGFLRGPMLPIYGFGTIIILIATIPVRSNIFLVFIFGMVAATTLEYFTGVLMEKIFHVRYWDYSDEAFNFQGHICLLCSVAWGAFSILMVKVIHPPIEYVVLLIPELICEIIILCIIVAFTIDIVQSVNDALDLKDTLARITEGRETVKHIKKRLEVMAAFINEDVKEIEEKFKEKVFINQEKSELRKLSRRQVFEKNLEKSNSRKAEVLELMSENINKYIGKLENVADKSTQQYEKFKAELIEYLAKIKKQENHVSKMENKAFVHSINILRRNPGARAKKYEEAMNEVKDLEKGQDI
ncbi:putative ABC transporter permease [uncultured Clostridium sp.]|uniref:putative ABC transporter permease n=1 Tax=uncultured Clostridium sp. TaxID=59620 RepID=UPI0025D3E358|nr:putative ABC transporter permease [uncultured Clostridium sp.]